VRRDRDETPGLGNVAVREGRQLSFRWFPSALIRAKMYPVIRESVRVLMNRLRRHHSGRFFDPFRHMVPTVLLVGTGPGG